jgi:hypothetical protein
MLGLIRFACALLLLVLRVPIAMSLAGVSSSFTLLRFKYDPAIHAFRSYLLSY